MKILPPIRRALLSFLNFSTLGMTASPCSIVFPLEASINAHRGDSSKHENHFVHNFAGVLSRFDAITMMRRRRKHVKTDDNIRQMRRRRPKRRSGGDFSQVFMAFSTSCRSDLSFWINQKPSKSPRKSLKSSCVVLEPFVLVQVQAR
jgi:hypothetical protein